MYYGTVNAFLTSTDWDVRFTIRKKTFYFIISFVLENGYEFKRLSLILKWFYRKHSRKQTCLYQYRQAKYFTTKNILWWVFDPGLESHTMFLMVLIYGWNIWHVCIDTDFRKAFDLVDSRLLLGNRFHHGFDTSVLDLTAR